MARMSQEQRLGILVARCGEVASIAGACIAWGIESHNPGDIGRTPRADLLLVALGVLKRMIVTIEKAWGDVDE